MYTYAALTDGRSADERADLDAIIDGRETPSEIRERAENQVAAWELARHGDVGQAVDIATAFVAIRPKVDAAAFKSETTQAITDPLAKAGKEGGEAAGTAMNSALATHAKRAAATLGGAFAGVQLGRKLFDSVQAASGLTEQANRVAVVFGDAAGSVEAFAATADQALGQSERFALQATGTFGALFASLGIGEQDAARFSIQLTTLASDLASFSDVPIEQAFEAIRSGLVGETEPLRIFGVNLNEAVLKQKALDDGLISSATGTLPAAAKAQAAMALILEQTTQAQGDFNRTRDSAANTEKRAAAETENAAASLGENFLPIYQKATELVGTLADAFGHLPGPAQTASVAIVGLAVAAAPILNTVRAVQALRVATLGEAAASTVATTAAEAHNAALEAGAFQAEAATVATSRFSTATSILVGSLGGLALAAGGAALILPILDNLGGSAPDVERLATAITAFDGSKLKGELADVFGSQGENIGKIIDDAEKALATTAQGGVKGALSDIGGAIVDPFGRGSTEINRGLGAVQSLDAALVKLVGDGKIEEAAALFEFFGRQAAKQGESIGDVTDLTPEYQAALEDLKLTADDTTNTMSRLNEAFLGNRRATLDATDAAQAVTDAQADLAEARADAAGTGERATAAAKRERDAQRALADAYEGSADAADTLADARRELAEFDAGPSSRIRELERIQIVRREITTPEEARQKEIDLLRFDQGVVDERGRLVDSVADAEQGVVDAAERVSDAQEKARDATRERGEVALEALGRVEELERVVEGAILDAVEAFEKAREAAEENGTSWAAWGVAIDDITAKLEPGSALRQHLEELREASLPVGGLAAAVSDFLAANPDAIPGLASGGVVAARPGGTIVRLGEGGQDEAVVPLDGRTTSGGLVVTQENHFHGGDVPTVTQLDAQNRKLGIRIGLWGRR